MTQKRLANKNTRAYSTQTGNRQPVKRKKRRRRRRLKPFVKYVLLGLAVAVIALIVILCIPKGKSSTDPSGGGKKGSASGQETVIPSEGESDTEQTTEIPPEEVRLVSSVTIGSTGDILIHPTVLNVFDMGDHHDFSGAFSYISSYYEQVDLMIANLEVTLVDPNDGYGYSSNPFASPENVAVTLKNAGVDICTTANNHTYDTGSYGLHHTQDVLDKCGLEYFGTRRSTSKPFILTKTVNDIKLGMINYTYETGPGSYYEKSLNFIPLDEDDTELVNTFNYDDLDAFYADAKEQLKAMDELGCEVKMFFMHWGEEYQDYPNGIQTEMAQKLCDLGVDVIIGGHPHVVQEFDVLESADGHQTICLYSMGNELSNQRRQYMNEDDYRGYTEDGIIFIVKIDKYNNGDVKIGGVDAVPTWVQDDYTFRIVPLDPAMAPDSWATDNVWDAQESYNRTMGRLGETFIEYRRSLGQADIPAEK